MCLFVIRDSAVCLPLEVFWVPPSHDDPKALTICCTAPAMPIGTAVVGHLRLNEIVRDELLYQYTDYSGAEPRNTHLSVGVISTLS